MKKTLWCIAVVVILLTVVLGAIKIQGEIAVVRDEDAILTDVGVFIFSVLHILIIVSEIGFFSGIALILSKNRTPLKLVFGAVIVIVTAVLLIVWIKSFLGGDI